MHKKLQYGLLVIGIVAVLVFALYYKTSGKSVSLDTASNSLLKLQSKPPKGNVNETAVTTVAENLDTPWAIAPLPDSSLLVTERKGTVKHIDQKGAVHEVEVIFNPDVMEAGEGGLLGAAVHPDFKENNFVYFYYTYRSDGENTLNRVVRFTYQNNALSDQQTILDRIPGASNHNGGRIKFGPDKLLYIGTGDAQEPSQAQDRNSLAGKILRVTDEGKVPSNNPFNNLVYSYGHRNVQGFAWDKQEQLWATEHGRSGVQSGLDEINRIEAGKNYGWPDIEGDETQNGMETAEKNSGANDTWAPAGAAFLGDSFLFGGLKGQALYEASTSNGNVVEFKQHFKDEYGRIRDVVLGGDGILYIATSNNDGRGNPTLNDDRILRLNLEKP